MSPNAHVHAERTRADMRSDVFMSFRSQCNYKETFYPKPTVYKNSFYLENWIILEKHES